MSLSASDILRNADTFRRAYPNWPHPEPEERAMTTEPRAEAIATSPAEEPARFFELDVDFPPEVCCPDCRESLELDALIRRHDRTGVPFSIGGLTLGDVADAANAHECAGDED
jgi:hypothetical protein